MLKLYSDTRPDKGGYSAQERCSYFMINKAYCNGSKLINIFTKELQS